MNSQTTEKAVAAPMRTRKGRKTLIVALVASVGAAALLVAESVSPSHLGNATPRINASTVGQGLGAFAAFAWIAFVWMCTTIRNILDVLLRIVISVVLLLVAAYFLFFAMLEMFMVG